MPKFSYIYKNESTELHVEDALYGSNYTHGYSAQITIRSGAYFYDQNVSVQMNLYPNGALVQVDDGGTFILNNCSLNSVSYNFVIVKGSNDTNSWSVEAARNDEKFVFSGELANALKNSEEIRQRYAEPELTTLLQNVLSKWLPQLQSGNISYRYLDYREEIKQIEDLAKTKYGITNSSDLINGILGHLLNITQSPTKTIFSFSVNDPDNWLYVTVCGIYPVCLYAFHFVFQYLHMKNPNKDLKFWLVEFVLMGTLIPSGINYLFFDRPYDYQVASIQTFIIFGIWIVGFFIVYKRNKILRVWRSREQNKYQQAKNDSKHEAKKTDEANKVN